MLITRALKNLNSKNIAFVSTKCMSMSTLNEKTWDVCKTCRKMVFSFKVNIEMYFVEPKSANVGRGDADPAPIGADPQRPLY